MTIPKKHLKVQTSKKSQAIGSNATAPTAAEIWLASKTREAIASKAPYCSVKFKPQQKTEVAEALERIERDPDLKLSIELVTILDRRVTIWLKGGWS
jgi:hypothetical protein